MESTLRLSLVGIYRDALKQVAPGVLMQKAMRVEGNTLHLSGAVPIPLPEKINLLAVGKAAAAMAKEAAHIFNPTATTQIENGLVITKQGFSLPGLDFPVLEAGHPVPDEAGLNAAEAAELMGWETSTLLLVLVSGGASALLPAPKKGLSLADKQAVSALMLGANLDIHQMNLVRKNLSRLKGGGLLPLAAPAKVVGVLLSDVPGDDPGVIGSGITLPEKPRPEAAAEVLKKADLWEQVPSEVRHILTFPPELPQSATRPYPPPINQIIGTNGHLLEAATTMAQTKGFTVVTDQTPLTGSNLEAGASLLAQWQKLKKNYPGLPLMLIKGGETTIKLTGKGKGGRCQDLAARMLPQMKEGEAFLAAGSDGNDGPTDAAGGVVDQPSWQRIQTEQIPYLPLLEDNDSFHLLQRSGNLIRIPPTRNNLGDIYLFAKM